MTSVTVDTPQHSQRTGWIVGAVLVVVILLVILLATVPSQDGDGASPIVGESAPAVAGTSLAGQQVDLSSYRGRWVVVNFFATWCIPCRNEHPELVRFSEANTGPSDPAIVAVGFDRNDVSRARSFFASEGGTWPVVPDSSGRISLDFGVRALPESFIVDPEGRVAQRISGEVTADRLTAITKA